MEPKCSGSYEPRQSMLQMPEDMELCRRLIDNCHLSQKGTAVMREKAAAAAAATAAATAAAAMGSTDEERRPSGAVHL